MTRKPPTRNSWEPRHNSKSFYVRETPRLPQDEPPRNATRVFLANAITRTFRRPVPDGSNTEDKDDDSTVGFPRNDEENTCVLSLDDNVPTDDDDGDDEGAGLLFNDEFYIMQQQVASNTNELRRFKKTVATSRRNRKTQMRELHRRIDVVEEDPVLPQDTYSFFAITRVVEVPVGSLLHSEKVKKSCRCPDLSFMIALSVLILQIVTLTFLAVDVINLDDKSNPLGIPPGVDWTVQVCQLIALFITVISQDEVRVSLNVLFDGYKGRAFDDQKCYSSSKAKWRASAFLRLGAGVYSLALTFILIIESNEVRDLLLNFTAVEFISNVDDTIFLLCTWGYFGPQVLNDAEVIANAKSVYQLDTRRHEDPDETEAVVNDKQDLSRAEADGSNSTLDVTAGSETVPESSEYLRDQTRCRCSRRALILVAMWLIMLFFWFLISVEQGSGRYMKPIVNVQFGDEHLASVDLGAFSGIYTLDTSGRVIFGGRKKYVATNGNAKFEYCRNMKRWTFSFGETPEQVVNPCTDQTVIRAQSSESNMFDLTRKPLDPWYYRSRSNISELVQLRRFSIDNREEECGISGYFNGNECICGKGWYGLNCRLGSCQEIQTRMGVFNDTRRHWSARYSILSRNETLVQAYGRPVLIGNLRRGDIDVMFFTGRRWVLTHTGRLPFNESQSTNTASLKSGISSFFRQDFHGHWSNYNVSFVSEPVNEPTELDWPNYAAMPTGLSWFIHRGRDSDEQLDVGASDRINAMLVCTCSMNSANKDAFTCQNDGICRADGTCECVTGSWGERCETTGLENGMCNPYFNTKEGHFDNGDCCVSTCAGSEFECGTVENGEYIGFPFCIDPEQLGNGICDMSLNNKEYDFDKGDCCEDTCNHTNCGMISESIFGGPIVGYPYCRDPDVPKWANITVVLELGSRPLNIGFHFVCDNNVYGDSFPGTFEEPFHRRTSTLVVPDGATCSLGVRGNQTDGRFKVYYGHTTTNEDMLVDDRNLAVDKGISFSASPPSMVSITVEAYRDSSTHPVKLGLLCTSLLQSHNELSLRELDFDGSGIALETVSVRRGSFCQFDERGKREYNITFGESRKPFFQGKQRDGERTKIYFKAISQMDTVQLVAVTEGGKSDQTTVGFRCHEATAFDDIHFSGEFFSSSWRHVYIVPKDSQCLFTATDSAGDFGGSFQLYYQEAKDEATLLFETEISYPHESVYFHASRPDNIVKTSMLYEVHNGPENIAFDLQCGASFPQDTVSKEVRSIVLVPNGTNCSFSMSSVPDSGIVACARGAGYYRVFDGVGTSTDKLLARGYQIEDEATSFTTDSLAQMLSFLIAVEIYDNSEGDTRLNVICDNALKVNSYFSGNGTQTLRVTEGASCELTFSSPSNSLSRFQVLSSDDDDDETEGNVIFFRGGGVDGITKVLFAASHQGQLAPITVALDENIESELGPSGDLGVRLSCDGHLATYFRFARAMYGTAHTFLVPPMTECEILIVDIGAVQCCDEDPRLYRVYYGTNETMAASDVIVDGNLTCREKLRFSTSPPTRGGARDRNLFGRMANVFLRGGRD